MKENYYQVELNRTVWEVPNRYKDLVPIGSGAYGQVCSSTDIEEQHQTPKVAIKKLARPFQSAIHAKRTYRFPNLNSSKIKMNFEKSIWKIFENLHY